MPDLKISELPPADPPAGGEVTPVVQGGVTRRATVAQLSRAAFAERSVHVRDFGAAGDGAADDAPAIQAAVEALRGQGGGVVQFGPRNYRIASPIVVSGVSVRFQGVGFTEAGAPGEGTWLTADNPSITPFTFTGAAARGSALRDIAAREIHPAPGPGWAPANYGWFARVEDCFGAVDFDNLLLAGVNRGILCRNSGRLDIRRLRGQVFTRAVEIDEAYDVPRLTNLHLWPYWSASDHVVHWQQANGDAFLFRRCDGVFVDQSFALGYRSMFRFAASAAGVTTKFNIGQAYADFVRHGIWIEAPGVDGQVDSMTTQGELFNAGGAPLPGAVGVFLASHSARVQIANLRVDDAEDHAVALLGHSNRLDVFALRCVNYNSRNNGAAAVLVGNAAVGQPNRVFLGTPAQLEAANPGPLANSGTNGTVAQGAAAAGAAGPAPAGTAAAPGAAVGSADTGLFQSADGGLALAAGGAEAARALPGGTVRLGGPSGGHALEVAAGAGVVNRLAAAGGAAGQAPSLSAAGSDANADLALVAKGSGGVVLRSGNGAALRAEAAAGANTALHLRAEAGLASVLTETALANAGIAVTAKGTGSVSLGAGGGVQLVVANTPAAVNTLQASGGATGTPGRVGWQATGADANIAAVVGQPKGTGALLAQFPDGAASGGAARGPHAVDLQTVRSAAAQVASGTNATVGGGSGNTASGNNATVAGGSGNAASGTGGAIPGGTLAADRGVANTLAFASGSFTSAAGTAQLTERVLRRATTDATASRLTSDGSATVGASNSANLPNNATFLVRLLVVARQTGGGAGAAGDSAGWEVTALLRRGASAAATALVGGGGAGLAPTFADTGAAGWRVAVAADASQGGVAVTATGEAGKNIQWVARISAVETVG